LRRSQTIIRCFQVDSVVSKASAAVVDTLAPQRTCSCTSRSRSASKVRTQQSHVFIRATANSPTPASSGDDSLIILPEKPRYDNCLANAASVAAFSGREFAARALACKSANKRLLSFLLMGTCKISLIIQKYGCFSELKVRERTAVVYMAGY